MLPYLQKQSIIHGCFNKPSNKYKIGCNQENDQPQTPYKFNLKEPKRVDGNRTMKRIKYSFKSFLKQQKDTSNSQVSIQPYSKQLRKKDGLQNKRQKKMLQYIEDEFRSEKNRVISKIYQRKKVKVDIPSAHQKLERECINQFNNQGQYQLESQRGGFNSHGYLRDSVYGKYSDEYSNILDQASLREDQFGFSNDPELVNFLLTQDNVQLYNDSKEFIKQSLDLDQKRIYTSITLEKEQNLINTQYPTHQQEEKIQKHLGQLYQIYQKKDNKIKIRNRENQTIENNKNKLNLQTKSKTFFEFLKGWTQWFCGDKNNISKTKAHQ